MHNTERCKLSSQEGVLDLELINDHGGTNLSPRYKKRILLINQPGTQDPKRLFSHSAGAKERGKNVIWSSKTFHNHLPRPLLLLTHSTATLSFVSHVVTSFASTTIYEPTTHSCASSLALRETNISGLTKSGSLSHPKDTFAGLWSELIRSTLTICINLITAACQLLSGPGGRRALNSEHQPSTTIMKTRDRDGGRGVNNHIWIFIKTR